MHNNPQFAGVPDLFITVFVQDFIVLYCYTATQLDSDFGGMTLSANWRCDMLLEYP